MISTLGCPYFAALGSRAPRALREMFPGAQRKARDLLGKLLVWDPRMRVSAEQALRHPYLNKYHDPEDEPVCSPTFDFSFEQQVEISIC